MARMTSTEYAEWKSTLDPVQGAYVNSCEYWQDQGTRAGKSKLLDPDTCVFLRTIVLHHYDSMSLARP